MNVNCPSCKKLVEWQAESEFRPFCSKRCQLIDLGQWADEAHVISDKSMAQNDMTEHLLNAEQSIDNELSPSQIEDIEEMLNNVSDEDFFKS